MISKIAITLASLKKEPFSGSHHGMRFYLKSEVIKDDDKKVIDSWLDAYYYPEPWCFEQTPDEEKVKKKFSLSAEGVEEAMVWLNEAFDAQRERWEDIEKRKMQIVLKGR